MIARLRHVFLSAFGALTLLASLNAGALPVLPGAVGYGTNTEAGRDATEENIYEVTSLDDSNLANPAIGTLRYGIERVPGPRVIVFRVSGVIELQSDLKVRVDSGSAVHGFVTIAGQTAPFPGITLKNGGIRVNGHDVLIQHIGIRPGNFVKGDEHLPPSQQVPDGWELSSLNNRDCIRVEGDAVNNVVVDHVTCTWSTDETGTTWWGSPQGTITNVTFANSIFADPIQFSGHTDAAGNPQQHGLGVLVGPGTSNMSIVRNVMAFNWSRNPLVRAKTSGAQIVNNFIYRPGPFVNGAMYIGSYGGFDTPSPSDDFPNFPMVVSAIGNVAVRSPALTWHGKNTDAHESGFFVHQNATSDLSLFLEGNYSYNPDMGVWHPTGSQYSSPFYAGRVVPVGKRLGSNPHANSGGTAWTPLSGTPEFLKSQIVPGAGKFSGQRDLYDAALIAKINDPNDQSTWLHSIDDLGPDPWGAVDLEGTPAFTIPDAPTEDADQDGYTNLEEELHRRSAVVEGRAYTDPAVVSFDTFTDGNADGWNTSVPGATGTWSVVANQLKQTNNTQNARAVLTASSWADQVVQAQVHVNGSGFGGNGFVAVYGRFNGINDTYYLTLRNTRVVELKRIKTNSSGTPVITTYGTTTLPALDFTQPHLLRLEIQGNKLRGWIDGTLLLSGSDNDDGFASGRAAVGTFLAEASFDNVFASPLRLASAKPDVTDDFDDNEASGWITTEAPGTWAVTADPTGSSNRVLTQSNATATDARATAPAVKADQSTQARVKGTTFTGNGFMAVFARYQNFDNSYYLLLRNSTRTLELKKIVSNVATPIGMLTLPATFDFTAWHTLRIDVTGNATKTTLRGYLDGELKLSGSDVPGSLTSGKGAVGTFQTAAKFDNLVLTSPP